MSEIDDEHEEFPQENFMRDAEVYTVPETGHLESSPVYLRNDRY